MGETAYPTKRTFFKTASGGGFTETDQVTSSGDPAFQADADCAVLYPTLPATGRLRQGEIYAYNGGMVIVEQDHDRTIYPPEDTPALFSVYRASNTGLAWVANEQVVGGDERDYGGKTYLCLQSHQTLASWTPDVTPALWKLKVVDIPVWVQPTGAHDAYRKGDKVHFPKITDPIYESLIDYNTYSPAAYPAGWKKL